MDERDTDAVTHNASALTVEKASLEVKKLRAEVEALRHAAKSQKKFSQRLKTWTPLVASILALVTGFWGAYEAIDRYLSQKERAYEVSISREIIDLAKLLASQDDREAGNAALLLSAFEADAIPVLVESLRSAEKASLRPRIIKSLKLISQKKRVAQMDGPIIAPLLATAQEACETETSKPEPSIEALDNYVTALEAFADSRWSGDLSEALDNLKKTLNSSESTVKIPVRQALLNRLDALRDEGGR